MTRKRLHRPHRHPRAEEPCFKVQLGPMISLPHPVCSARWKRLALVYAIVDRLLSARDLTGLTIAVQRDWLWRMQRERPLAGGRMSGGNSAGESAEVPRQHE